MGLYTRFCRRLASRLAQQPLYFTAGERHFSAVNTANHPLNKMNSPELDESPVVWILTDGRAGSDRQAVGFARALQQPFQIIRLYRRLPWHALTPYIYVPLGLAYQPFTWPAVKPAIVIGAGRWITAALQAVKRRWPDCQTIQLLYPGIAARYFDVMLLPEHDGRTGKGIHTYIGSLHDWTAERLNALKAQTAEQIMPYPAPRLAVLLGGQSKTFRWHEALAQKLVSDLLTWQQQTGGSIWITPSRRTPPAIKTIFENALLHKANIWWWNGQGENPYATFLTNADAFLVTSDSVNMASEAAITGKPIWLYPLAGHSAKHARFHQTLIDRGIARWWDGNGLTQWTYIPLDETKRLAKLLYSP